MLSKVVSPSLSLLDGVKEESNRPWPLAHPGTSLSPCFSPWGLSPGRASLQIWDCGLGFGAEPQRPASAAPHMTWGDEPQFPELCAHMGTPPCRAAPGSQEMVRAEPLARRGCAVIVPVIRGPGVLWGCLSLRSDQWVPRVAFWACSPRISPDSSLATCLFQPC